MKSKEEGPVHEHRIINGIGYFIITHIYKINEKTISIKIEEKYNPYNSWDKYDAINKAKEQYNQKYFNIKS